MRKLIFTVTAATLMMAPVQAADLQGQAMDMRPGGGGGAGVGAPGGPRPPPRPRAALAIAPTMNRISSAGMARASIGEGLALNFSPRTKPTLTLAGVRADQALGLRPQDQVEGDEKLGVSTGGWVAIGVGAAVLVGAAAFLIAIDCDESDSSDDCP